LVDLRFRGIEAGARSPKFIIGAVCASIKAGGELVALSGLVSREACVTLPAIAWPPSLTDTCCTVPARLRAGLSHLSRHLRLAGSYGAERLEAAAERAIDIGTCSNIQPSINSTPFGLHGMAKALRLAAR
jgi:hypothetical protein